MTSQLPRAALALTLLLSALRLAVAAPRPTQQEVEAVRQQHVQALARGDIAAAARFGGEDAYRFAWKRLAMRRPNSSKGLTVPCSSRNSRWTSRMNSWK